MIPMEIKAMEVLRDNVHSTAIITMNKWRPHFGGGFYRMFLEYAPHKSVSHLCDWYLTKQPEEGFAFEDPNNGYSNHIPEPFIWHLFEVLVQAGLDMEGALKDDEDVNDKGKVIVHRDLKPNNVFLSGPAAGGSYAMYPTPKVGDFGYAVMTRDNDVNNPRIYTGSGTDGFKAPEMVELKYPDSFKLNSKTNVWQIGKTLMAVMGHEAIAQGNGKGMDDPGRQLGYSLEDREPAWPFQALIYSQTLRDLVASCTRFNPADRPTLNGLLRGVRNNTGRSVAVPSAADRSNGLQSVTDPNDARIQQQDRLRIEQTPWQVVAAIPDAFAGMAGMAPFVLPTAGAAAPAGGGTGGGGGGSY